MFGALRVCVSSVSMDIIAVAIRGISISCPPAADLDLGFARHLFLTPADTIPGLVFVVLGPFQFMARLRKPYPVLRRSTGYVVLADALVIGATALM